MKQNQILRLNRGDEIISGILDFCKKNNISSAWFTGLGAASKATLALYNLENKKYIRKEIAGPLEIVNIIGNIAMKDNELAIHCHVTFGDKKMDTYAGHLERATVAGTCEIVFRLLDVKLIRKHDPDTGLNLLEI